jgi:small subunit ribosomal protein S3
MKRATQTAMEFGALGVRIRVAGRLGGADIARAEWYLEGKVPLQTLRTPIDYGFAEARTLYGIIGIKCWVNKKEMTEEEARQAAANRPQRRPRGEGRPGGRGGDRGGRGGDRRGRGPAQDAAPSEEGGDAAAADAPATE